MHIVVFGAGAVGSTLGGLLALRKHDVVLVGRGNHAKAIKTQNGLRMRSPTGDYFASLKATSKLLRAGFGDDSCIFFTPKSNDTSSCVQELSKSAPREIPVVSFQNGIANEEIISKKFPNVYGGVCRMTCSFIHPGQVTFRKIGRVILGKYPKGSDPFVRKLAGFFEGAGFQCAISKAVICDKWLKLVVNLQSALHAMIDGRDHDSIEFTKLKIGVLEEAKKVLRAGRIRARSCDRRDASIDEMISELGKPKAPRSASYLKVRNSTWQNLYLKRSEIESAYFHGPIIELAKKHGIPVPFNRVTLELVTRCHAQGLGPEALRAREVLEQVRKKGGKG